MFSNLRDNKALLLFLIVYSVFMIINLRPTYLDSDEASHAMTSLFYHDLIKDLAENPTVNPSSIYDYAKTYYIHYPKFSFIYGPVYTLLGGVVFLLTSPSIIILRIITLLMGIASLIILYAGLRNWFNKSVSTIAVLITATSHIFFDNALRVMLDVPAFMFFTASFYFFTKSFNKPVLKNFFLCGLFSAVSIMTKEVAFAYAAGLFLIYLFNLKKFGVKKISVAAAGLLITLTPYLLFAYFAGGVEVLLKIPLRTGWYGSQYSDPQWYNAESWLYFFNALASNFSLLFTILFIPCLFALLFTKDNKSRLMLGLFLINYLFVAFSPHKITRLLSLGLGYYGFIFSKSFNDLFTVRKKSLRTLSFSLTILVLAIQLPLSSNVINTPMAQVADELVNLCPDGCSVLIASEYASVYSSYLMYESMLRDDDASMRFVRPVSLISNPAPDLINDELINYVVVIGSLEFIEQSSEMADYFKNVQYVINRYSLVSSYESDVVGQISIYSTGIDQLKTAPVCSPALGINTTFCTNYPLPIDALV